MRKLLVLLIFGLFATSLSKAQVTEQEMSLIGSILKSEVKVFFAQNIKLATSEAEVFWATYDDYNEELKPVSEQRVELIKNVIQKEGEITEDELDSKIMSLSKILKKRQAIRMKYYKILKKKLGVKVASQFYQIDGYIYIQIAASLNESMPIIVPTEGD